MKYRLPEELCGADYTPTTVVEGVATFDIPGVGRVNLPVQSLTEVGPRLPDEPPMGAVVVIYHDARIPLAYLRSVVDGRDGWRLGGQRSAAEPASWREICNFDGEHVRFDRAAVEPVSLPCRISTGQGRDAFVVEDERGIWAGLVEGNYRRWTVPLSPDAARKAAGALLAAADAAEVAP